MSVKYLGVQATHPVQPSAGTYNLYVYSPNGKLYAQDSSNNKRTWVDESGEDLAALHAMVCGWDTSHGYPFLTDTFEDFSEVDTGESTNIRIDRQARKITGPHSHEDGYIIDDFDGYSSDGELQAQWVTSDASDIQGLSETTVVSEGTRSMEVSVGAAGEGGELTKTLSVTEDWSAFYGLGMKFYGNAKIAIRMFVEDSSGRRIITHIAETIPGEWVYTQASFVQMLDVQMDHADITDVKKIGIKISRATNASVYIDWLHLESGGKVGTDVTLTSKAVTADATNSESNDEALIVSETRVGPGGSLVLFVSRDDGTTWTAINDSEWTDISAQPSGTDMRYKVEFDGNTEVRGIVMKWR